MDSTYSEEYKEKQTPSTLQKRALERSYKIARSMLDPLPPKNSSLFHPRKHDDKIEVEITTIRSNSRNLSQNQQYSYNGSRTPNNFTKTSPTKYAYRSSSSPDRTPKKDRNHSYVSEPSSAFASKNYYHFLNEYSSSFMNSNSSSPSHSPRIKYGNGHNSYYYTELEPRVSKHFSPSKGSSSPIMPDSFEKTHSSPPTFRYSHQYRENGYDSRNSPNSNFQRRNLDLNENEKRGSFNENMKRSNFSGNDRRGNFSGNDRRSNFSGNDRRSNFSDNDQRISVGVQRSNTGKYQYEEEPFNKLIEEEEEEIDMNNNSELNMTAGTISDILNDDQLVKDRELLNKHLRSDFHHDGWNGEAEPNPEIDDTKLDQRVQMIIKRLREQNSLSAQNSLLGDNHINDNNHKQNAPQGFTDYQTNMSVQVADRITYNTNQRVINLNEKNSP